MGNKPGGNAYLGESADVDAVLGVELEWETLSVTGWNGSFSISIGDIFRTTGTI